MAEVIPAEFARICGVAPSVISRKIKHGTLVKNSAGKLDTENPVNARYASRRRQKMTTEALEDDGKNAERILERTDFTVFDDYKLSEHTGLPKHLLGMTIRDLVITYKGLEGLERYVRMLKDLAVADEKDQKNQERRLKLIDKDFVVSRVFQYLDVLMKQLFEYPEASVDVIISLALSKGIEARQDISRAMELGLTKIISGAKEHVVKELAALRAKYQDNDKDDKMEEIREAIEEAMDD